MEREIPIYGRQIMFKQISAYVFTTLLCLPILYADNCDEGSEKDTKKCLWDWGSENRKIAWVAWDKVCQSKNKGGLGVIDIGKFNLALIGKWIWRLKSEERSLWKVILESKYGGWRGLRSQGQIRKESLWWRDLRKV